MQSYQKLFADRSRAKLIPFFVLGDPTPESSVELIMAAVEAGADALELGIPFSDPIADGPTIQKADIRALEQGMTCAKAFDLISQIRAKTDIPIGLLLYYNLVCHYGIEAFYRDAAQAGVNSVLIADLCVDDAAEVAQEIEKNGLESVYMITPNTSAERQNKIAQLCSGLIYTVAVLGVTGARDQVSANVAPLIAQLKQQTDAPICVGFGISKPEHCKTMAQAGADGMFVGSAVVKVIEDNLDTPDHGRAKLKAFIESLVQAVRS